MHECVVVRLDNPDFGLAEGVDSLTDEEFAERVAGL